MTRAMERMLEVLPFGASKASGVVKALDLLGLRPGDCLAMGDGMFCTIKSNQIKSHSNIRSPCFLCDIMATLNDFMLFQEKTTWK